MGDKDTLVQGDYELERESAFSYQCNACKRCCHNKAIRVTPYEILRLARRLGLSTTDFIAHHTVAGGTVLRTRDDDDACVFLNERGCGVHPDRPVVCRIYPLGRYVDPQGQESFAHLTPHPETAGVYGVSGTVASFLQGQGVAQFFDMGDRYDALYQRMVDVLERLDPKELDRRAARRNDVDCVEAGTAACSWIDIDETVAAYCKAQGRAVPDGIDDTVALHIEAVGHWLARIESAIASKPI